MKKVINNYFLFEKNEIVEQIKKIREENKKFMLYVCESKKDLILTNKQDDILEDLNINYIFRIHPTNNIINRGFRHITQTNYKDEIIFKDSSIEDFKIIFNYWYTIRKYHKITVNEYFYHQY